MSGLIAAKILGFMMRPFEKQTHHVKAVICIIVLILINVVTELTHFHEAKYVAVIFYGYFTKLEWHKDDPDEDLMAVWKIGKPFLFGSIGAAVDISVIKFSYVISSFLIIVGGEIARFISVILCTCG